MGVFLDFARQGFATFMHIPLAGTNSLRSQYIVFPTPHTSLSAASYCKYSQVFASIGNQPTFAILIKEDLRATRPCILPRLCE